jgi:hypothetical protein
MIATIAMNGFKVEPLDENPMIGPSAQTTLIKMGARIAKIVIEDEGWRLCHRQCFMQVWFIILSICLRCGSSEPH